MYHEKSLVSKVCKAKPNPSDQRMREAHIVVCSVYDCVERWIFRSLGVTYFDLKPVSDGI